MNSLLKNVMLGKDSKPLNSNTPQETDVPQAAEDIECERLNGHSRIKEPNGSGAYAPKIENQQPAVSRSELKQMFAEEIAEIYAEAKREGLEQAGREANLLIEEEKNKALIKLNEDYEKKLKTLEDETKSLQTTSESLHSLMNSLLAESVENKQMLESHVLVLTLECLYKLLGRTDLYEAAIKDVLRASMQNIEDILPTKIRLSQHDHNLFVADAEWKDLVKHMHVDNELLPGQCKIESGASVTDISIIEQLDKLRQILINTFSARRQQS